MTLTEKDTAYEDFRKWMNQVAWQLNSIQSNWQKERGKVPFDSYVPVISYLLRTQTPLDINTISIKAKGYSIIIVQKLLINGQDVYCKCTIANSELRTQLSSVRELTQDEYLEQLKKDFPKYCERHGLKPSDFGARVIDSEDELEIVGCKSRKQKFGVICKNITRDQLMYIKASYIQKLLQKKG